METLNFLNDAVELNAIEMLTIKGGNAGPGTKGTDGNQEDTPDILQG